MWVLTLISVELSSLSSPSSPPSPFLLFTPLILLTLSESGSTIPAPGVFIWGFDWTCHVEKVNLKVGLEFCAVQVNEKAPGMTLIFWSYRFLIWQPKLLSLFSSGYKTSPGLNSNMRIWSIVFYKLNNRGYLLSVLYFNWDYCKQITSVYLTSFPPTLVLFCYTIQVFSYCLTVSYIYKLYFIHCHSPFPFFPSSTENVLLIMVLIKLPW